MAIWMSVRQLIYVEIRNAGEDVGKITRQGTFVHFKLLWPAWCSLACDETRPVWCVQFHVQQTRSQGVERCKVNPPAVSRRRPTRVRVMFNGAESKSGTLSDVLHVRGFATRRGSRVLQSRVTVNGSTQANEHAVSMAGAHF